MSFIYLQMIVKAPGFYSSASVWKSGLHTGDKVISEACGLCKTIKTYKTLYTNPLLHPRDSPCAETSVKDVEQILTWQCRNKNLQATKMLTGLRVFIQWGQVPKLTSKGQWVMSLYKLWPRPSIIQHAVSPSRVWKACMTRTTNSTLELTIT